MAQYDVADKILDVAQKRMLKYGYRKMTMDEIAADLAMSKNTIYKHFKSKEEIAKSLVNRLQTQINIRLLEIEKSETDPLKVFSNSVFLMRKQLGPWFEHFFREIPVELPGLWEEFMRYRNEKILGIRLFVEKGIKKGIFRKVNASIAVQAYLGAVKAILSPKFLEEEHLAFDHALDQIMDIWSNGMVKNNES